MIENPLPRRSRAHVSLSRLDGLGLFGGMWAVTELFHLISFGVWIYEPVGILLFLGTIALLARPSSAARLFVACSLDAVYVFVRSPHTANHILFNGLVSFTIALVLATCWWRSRRNGFDREEAFGRLRGPIRGEVLVLYVFAVLHKLNVDFLNPEVSAAGELLRQLRDRFAFVPTDDASIVATAIGTLVVEALIPLLLVSRRWASWGVLLGMVFHFGLSLHPHQGIFSFSAMLFLLYTFFLPRDFVERLRTWVSESAFANRVLETVAALRTRAMLVAAGLVGVVVVSASTVLILGVDLKHLREQALLIGTFLWVPWATFVFLVVVRTLRTPSAGDAGAAPRFGFRPALLVPVVMIAFYLGPYFGFGTTRCLSMFSNLRTEGTQPNHLFIPKSWQLLSYQDDLVEVVATNEPTFSELVENRELLPYFEFRRSVHDLGGPLRVEYLRGGERRVVDTTDGSAPAVPDVPWLPGKLMSFRPVDKSGPAKSRW